MSVTDSQSDDFVIIDSWEASLAPKDLEQLQEWLQPTDYMAESGEFSRHLSSQAPGTGLWICDTEKFKQWHDSEIQGSLWITGIPGAGKSVIAASMVENLRSQENVPVLFFFFRQTIAANQRPRLLIRDWLAQLLPHSLRLQASLHPMLNSELSDLSDEHLWEHLLIGLSSIGKVYCVVDAIDEMDLIDDDAFLVRLNSLAAFRPQYFKLLVTSRPKRYLEINFRDKSIDHISLESDLVGKDIGHFVSHRLKLAIPQNNNADLLESLLSMICTRSRGLFLYARLLLDQITPILQSEKQLDVETLYKSLPIALEEIYNSMLFQQAEALNIETDIQVFLLECATYSTRNLCLNELANFLQFKFPPSMIPATPKAIARAACAPLLEIMEDETVQVIHYSFTEFLLDRERITRLGKTARQFPILNPQNAHRMLAIACLEYLHSGVLESQRAENCSCDEGVECSCRDESHKYDYQQARLQHPFLDYAVQNWAYHASNYDVEDESFFASIQAFTEADSSFRRWLSLVKASKYLLSTVQAPSVLRIAATAGLVQYVCQQGHTEIILVMIPFFPPNTLKEILCETCRYGKFESTRAILENSDVSVNSRFAGATALFLACVGRSVDCVQMLLDRGADIHSISEWRQFPRINGGSHGAQSPRSPLQYLVHTWDDSNHSVSVQIFQMLIRAGANLNEKDSNGETPLLSQFRKRHTPGILTVRTLLEAGANTSDVDKDGDTILHRFLDANRDVEMLDLLLKYGADVNACGSHGNSVLHVVLGENGGILSSKNSFQEIIEYLLQKGALSNVRNASGRSVLRVAMFSSRTCNLESFRLLLRSCPNESVRNECLWFIGSRPGKEQLQFIRELQAVGVSLDNRNSKGETVLLLTIRMGSTWKYLVDCGASLDAIDSKGRGALHHFIRSTSSTKRLQRRIDAGLDPRRTDYEGKTLLHIAASYYQGTPEEVEVIEYLLSLGLSVNAKTKLGSTPLQLNIEKSRSKNLETDCSNDAPRIPLLNVFQKSRNMLDINLRDNEGLSALHLSAVDYDIDVSRMLDAGADPTLVTKNGRTALHLACRARRSGVVALLLHKTEGNIIANKDSLGRTALHDACASGRPESVYYLLKFGADIAARDAHGRTPLHSCAEFIPQERTWSWPEGRNTADGIELASRYRSLSRYNYRTGEAWCASKSLSMLNLSDYDTSRIGGIIKSLLAAGADPTAVDAHSLSPLELALHHDRHEMVQALHFTMDDIKKRWLLEPNATGFCTGVALNQWTPIRCRDLPEHAQQEILHHPVRYIAPMGADDIDWLIQRGANLTGVDGENIHDLNATSFLHFVASNGLIEMMECLGTLARYYDDPASVKALLLEDDNIIGDMEHFTPILQAACRRALPNIQMMHTLVEKCQVDINGRALVLTKDYGRVASDSVAGPTALHVLAEASRWWYLDAIRYLVEQGANIDLRNERGETPLHMACIGARPTMWHISRRRPGPGFWSADCVRLLLDLGADPNALDNNGMSPLNSAKTNPKAMKILLERGADICACATSPLFSAIQSQNYETLRIMLDAGADPNIKDTAKAFHTHEVKGQER